MADPGGTVERIEGGSFVGRERVLSHLEADLDAARGGRSAWSLLVGEAGIGKTRTAVVAGERARAQGFRILAGRCPEAEKAPAYRPWAQVCRSLLAQAESAERGALLAALGPGWRDLAALLPELAPDDACATRDPAPAESRFLFFESVAALLAAGAQRIPLLLWLDDLHAADADSLALLAFCARELPTARIACLGAWREPDLDAAVDGAARRAPLARAFREIPLDGLSADEVRRFLGGVLSRAPSDPMVVTASARTGGNPLYLTELARMLALEGKFEDASGDDLARVAVPRGLAEMLCRRVARLSPDAQRLLACAAVLGREIDAGLLEALLPPALRPEAGALLQEARAARLLVPAGDGGLAFGHALIQEQVHQGLEPRERARLHAAAAQALAAAGAGERAAERLAHHARAAMPVDGPEPALRWTVAAARAALHRRAFAEACVQYREALELSDGLGASADGRHRSASIRLELAAALARAGAGDEAQAACREAARAARALGDGVLLARAALAFAGDGTGTASQEPDPERIALLEEALAGVPAERTDLRVPLLARLATELHWSPDIERRRSLAADAVALARASGDPGLLVQALVGRIWASWGPDELEIREAAASEAIELSARALDLGATLVHARIARAAARLERGDLEGCRTDLAAAESLALESRQGVGAIFCGQMRATLALLAGDLAGAEAIAARNLALGQRRVAPQAAPIYGLQLVLLRAAQDRDGELEAALAATAARSRSPLPRALLAWVRAHMGKLAAARRDLRALLRDVDERPRDLLWLGTMALAAEVVFAARDRESAERLYEQLLPYAERNVLLGMSGGCLGPAARSLGLLAAILGRSEQAERHFADAIVGAERLHAPLWRAQAQLDLATLLDEKPGRRGAAPAAELRAEAEDALATLGVPARPKEKPATGPEREATLAWNGQVWSARFGDTEAAIPDSLGVRYLARLLERGEQEIHVLDLHEAAGPRRARAAPRLDPRARSEYRERVAELRAELEDAERRGDPERRERAQAEIEVIGAELGRAFGLGSRPRRLGDDAERARKAVYNRVRDAIARIAAAHPALGRHLERSTRTGTFCLYAPEQPVRWEVRWP